MADDRVPGNRLRHQDGVRPAAGLEQALDPAVLIPEHDLEEEHLLAVGLEPEVAWLDDAGMHRPHRHLVDLLTVDLEERIPLPVDRLPVGDDRRRGRSDGGAPASSHGCPSGTTPHCSAISRSKRCASGTFRCERG